MRGVRRGWSFGVLGAALALSGCTTVLYPGPSRPSGEVALLESKDAAIEFIDGQQVSGRKYEILPGLHSVIVHLAAARAGFNSVTVFYSKGGIGVCFFAKPGRTYLAMPEIVEEGKWAPQIVDEETTYPVKILHPGVDPSCRAPRRRAGED